MYTFFMKHLELNVNQGKHNEIQGPEKQNSPLMPGCTGFELAQPIVFNLHAAQLHQ